MNIYVANIPYNTTEEELKKLFENYGNVDSCKIIKDKSTGNSRGFGFVEIPDDSIANTLLQDRETEGKNIMLEGRKLLISPAKTR